MESDGTVNPKREALSDYAHAAWSGWMQYMFGKCVRLPNGSVIVPSSLVERWTRQMNTAYGDLPEGEKESDRAEADKILGIIQWS